MEDRLGNLEEAVNLQGFSKKCAGVSMPVYRYRFMAEETPAI